MLDGAHALAHGELDVLGGDVVLEIDEGLHLLRIVGMRNRAVIAAGSRNGAGDAEGALARRSRRRRARAMPFGKRGRQLEHAVTGAGGALVLRRDAGNIDLPRRVEGELAAGLREEMHGGRPSPRHQHEIAGDLAHGPDGAVEADGAQAGS